jgi:hypothetical protein
VKGCRHGRKLAGGMSAHHPEVTVSSRPNADLAVGVT